MSLGLSQSALPAELMRGCRFAQDFWDRGSMLRDGWTFTNNPTVNEGITCDGVNQKAEWSGVVVGVQSVSFWVTLGSTTEDILQLSATHSIEVGAGTLTATGWAAPTIMVNGVVTAVITTARSFVTVTTATPFDADDIAVGEVATYGDFKLEDLKAWANGCVLTLQEALDYTNNATWNWENLLKCNLQFRTGDYDPVNVQTLDSSGNGNHAQLGDGSTPATYPSQGKGRMSFDGGDWLDLGSQVYSATGDYTFLFTTSLLTIPGVVAYLFDWRNAGLGVGATIPSTGTIQFGTDLIGAADRVETGVLSWSAPKTIALVHYASGGVTVLSIYVDGVLVVSATKNAGTNTTANHYIGQKYNSTFRVTGTLHDSKVEHFAMSPTQIMDYHISQMRVIGHQL